MLRLDVLARRAAFELRTKGLYRGTRAVLSQILRPRVPVGTEYDARTGVDTAGNVPMWALSIDSENAHLGEPYQPTKESELRQTLGALGLRAAGYTFIDLGCGKGMALLVASEFGFRGIVGVEFAKELAAVARRNLEAKGIGGEVHTMDAGKYQLPAEPFVLYLYNPFRGEVFAKMLENLKAVKHRDFLLIYCQAIETVQLSTCGFLRLDRTIETSPPTEIWTPI
jgi:hypothetical protein